MAGTKSLEDLGEQRSVFGARFVGAMRALAATGGIAVAGAGVTLGLGYLESRFPKVRHVKVPIPAQSGFGGLRVLHISDLHLFSGQDFIIRFLKRVAEQEQFDLVISTGDNLSDLSGIPLLFDALAPLTHKPGVFVLGSNDYYLPEPKPWASYLSPRHHEKAGKKASVSTPDLPWAKVVRDLTDLGWIDLTNRSIELDVPSPSGVAKVALAGVDDPHILRDHMPKPVEAWRDPSAVRLALAHAPYRRVLDEFTNMGADVIFSGHTHGGQIRLPFFGALVNNTDIDIKYSRGLYRWITDKAQSWLHISAGLGTSRFAPVRLFCRPEVSVLHLTPA